MEALLLRSQAEADLLAEGWTMPPAAPPSAALDSRRVRLLFHSRAPLVPNGYAARSVEIIGVARAAGWSASAVTRLGYPTDINRFRTARVPEEEDYAGVPCRLLRDPGDGMRGRTLPDYLQAYADAIVRLEQSDPPAVLHAASSYHNGLAAAAAARRLGIASVYEARGLWEVTALSRGDLAPDHHRFRLAARLEADAARAAGAVIALSGGIRDALVGRGVPQEKVFVAPNCVETPGVTAETEAARAAARAELGLVPAALVVGYVGSMVDYEGLDGLVAAMRSAVADGGDIAAFIVGDGAARPAIEAAVRAAGLGNRLVLRPPTDRAGAARLAAAADVVALPRRDLPVTRIVPPIKLAEALSRGQPILVSDVPALAELVTDGETGVVVTPGDTDALAAVLTALSRDPGRVARMGVAARRAAAERFSYEAVGAVLTRAYTHAIEAARAAT